MKKIILLILLLAGIYPSIEHGHLLITASQTAYAQSNMDGVEICATYTEDIQYHYDGPETTVTTTVCLVKIDCNTLDEIGEREDCQETIVVNGPCENYGPDARYDPECGCIGPGTTMEECPEPDCYGESGGTAYESDCGCVGGSTGIPDCPEEPPVPDCHGTPNGTAKLDACGICVGGLTGKTATKWYYDSDGDGWGGTTTKTCYEGGSGWVNKGGDKNDNCPNATNDPVQCTPCDRTHASYDPVVCNCPCAKLTPYAEGGVLRNYNGDVIHAEGTAQSVTGTGDYAGYVFTVRTDLIYSSHGGAMEVQVITGVVKDGVNRPDLADNMTYNCLGWALTGGHFIIDAGDTNGINNIFGISSISNAQTAGTFRTDFENIEVGQVLLILSSGSAGYVHAAVYEGNGKYSTKNGMGNGDNGVLSWSLQDIQDLYYQLGGAVSVFTNGPPKTNSGSNLGVGNGGKTSLVAATNGTTNGCPCVAGN